MPSATVVRRYTNETQEPINAGFVSDDGGTAWAYQQQTEILAPACQGEPPPSSSCVVSSHAVMFNKIGAAIFDTGPDGVDTMNTYGNGRFFVYDKFPIEFGAGPPGPVHIIDWATTNHVDTLSGAATFTETDSVVCLLLGGGSAPCTLKASSASGQMSDDLSVVATTTGSGNGWYEHTTSP